MTMSASQRAYEEKRAAKHGMSLKQWLAAKATVAAVGKTPIIPSKMARGTGVRLTTRMLVGLLPEDSLAEGNFLQRNKMVRSLAVMPDGTVIASVEDHRRRWFDLMAAIVEQDGRLELDDKCTCRLGRRCSHVAAAMLAALADHEISPQTSAQPQFKVQKTQPAPPARHPVELWLDRLIERAAESPPRDKVLAQWPPAQGQQVSEMIAGRDAVIYFLDADESNGRQRPFLRAEQARVLKSGSLGRSRPVPAWQMASCPPVNFTNQDRAIIGAINELGTGKARPVSEGRTLAATALFQALSSGRCFWRDRDDPPLRCGPVRTGKVQWVPLSGGQVLVAVVDEPGVVVFSSVLPFYVDAARGEAGPLDLGVPAVVAATLFEGPQVDKGHREAVLEAFAGPLAKLALPTPERKFVEEVIRVKPVPRLRLLPEQVGAEGSGEIAMLTFVYGAIEIDPATSPAKPRRVDGNRILIVHRSHEKEQAAFRRLVDSGLRCCDQDGEGAVWSFDEEIDPDSHWLEFVHRTMPALRDSGWQVEPSQEFRHRVVDGGLDWRADVSEGEGGFSDWFSLDLGIEVDGERVALLPLLVQALGRIKDPTAPGAVDQLAVGGTVYVQLADGRALGLPLERTRAILNTLVELHEAGSLGADGRIKVSVGQAAALAQLESALQVRWFGPERLLALTRRLRDFQGVQPVAPPSGFTVTLRPYQRIGLDWLQFLRDFELSGILADDMGLGKTVQTLAHILVEKQAGRLDRPAMVICPTSLVPNWRSEAARFAPDLRVVVLHGTGRSELMADALAADLVITTYPLLTRDAETLERTEWHLVVLDEAQAIKNPAAKATQVACRLKARHRLCLTGTPVENHLGELWSEFAFLMPGLLGDHKRFGRLFRTPIEKHGDRDRRQGLAARVRPFMLRRTKSEVAAELPAKTEIIRHVELATAQRDLYETLRLAMHQKVQRVVAEKGLARSQIEVLDALLKLRQACCDPRLVKLESARAVRESAKLNLLMEMLPEMIEEGRRILLFSQFTGMLDLIKVAVDAAGIPYVELRGDTRDRATPVARFQACEVPLFLISLKAGGVGLNLTAADTVIHYDPWWNPAAERQATDRAHRIGQDKPVFVYKLIAEGTIEERMLALQERKKGLAEALFDPAAAGKVSIDAADLELLFEPLN